MTKRKATKDKRYRVVIQVAIWNYQHTRVTGYERQTLLVKAKNPTKAVEKANTLHSVLKVCLDA